MITRSVWHYHSAVSPNMWRGLIPLSVIELVLIVLFIMFDSASIGFILGLSASQEIKMIWMLVFVAAVGQGFAMRHIIERVCERRKGQRGER